VNLSGPGPLDEIDLELLDLLQRNVARTLRDYASLLVTSGMHDALTIDHVLLADRDQAAKLRCRERAEVEALVLHLHEVRVAPRSRA
jgi:hypothetical protein